MELFLIFKIYLLKSINKIPNLIVDKIRRIVVVQIDFNSYFCD